MSLLWLCGFSISVVILFSVLITFVSSTLVVMDWLICWRLFCLFCLVCALRVVFGRVVVV